MDRRAAKFIIALVALVLTGSLLGGMIGYFIGLMIESVRYGTRTHQRKAWYDAWQTPWQRVQETRGVFFASTFKVMGHIAKADGRVSEQDIALARQVMQQMSLSQEMRMKAIAFFNEGKRPGFQLQATLNELRSVCGFQRHLLTLFVDIQSRYVQAAGRSPSQLRILDQIFQFFGLGQRYEGAGAYQRQSSGAQGARASGGDDLSHAYACLGMKRPATEGQVKKAYRKLMSQNHPDKLMAKGLPEEMIKLATEKTQQIRSAYELICRHRDFAT